MYGYYGQRNVVTHFNKKSKETGSVKTQKWQAKYLSAANGLLELQNYNP
jgi:hypothetical protein